MVTDAQNIIAIIPMKPLSQGKSRLSQDLTAEQRADLVLGMLRRVILAINGANAIRFGLLEGTKEFKNWLAHLEPCGWKNWELT